jgi:leader peptidase (prepilin peptidase)/N-methyltransferase
LETLNLLPKALALVAAPAAGWLCARLAGRIAPPAGPLWAFIALDLGVAISAVAVAPIAAMAASLALGWALALLAAVDVKVMRLPDLITLPLLAAGLAIGPLTLKTPWLDHVAGAGVGYLSLAVLGWAFARIRGKQGLGLGDAKLLAAAGAWLGWRALPAVVVIAAGAGLAWAGVLLLRKGRKALAQPIPFGPPLCLAAWIMWLIAAGNVGTYYPPDR